MFQRVLSSPHIHPGGNSVRRTMLLVCLALVPGSLAHAWFFGPGILVNIAVAILFTLAAEALLLRLRHRPLAPFLGDGSAVLTAWLLALALPPLMPWWLIAIGAFSAMALGKHLYGGLGHNPFNPAMVGYAVLLISFPREMTAWLPPEGAGEAALSLGAHLHYLASGTLPAGLTLDALTQATPLDVLKTELGQQALISEIRADSAIFGDIGGVGWEWIATLFLVGGLWLAYKRVIPWQTPAGVILGVGGLAFLFHAIDPSTYATPAFHVLSGATVLAAFFIATDPVSSPASHWGRFWYGIGIGVLIHVIRTWGGYPDGVAFAVLLMNMAVPTIDTYLKPRAFGRNRE